MRYIAFCEAIRACVYWSRMAFNPPKIDQATVDRRFRGIVEANDRPLPPSRFTITR